jgi:hypothetical protein
VDVYEGAVTPANLLGAASIVDGAWSLSTMLAPGVYNALEVVATDNAGNTTTAAAPFTLKTGITGHSYTALEEIYADGALTGQTFFNNDGSVFRADTVAPDGHGGLDYTYSSGSFFTGKPYASVEKDYNSSHALISRTLFNSDGSVYLAGTVAPDGHGGLDYTYSSGSYFIGKPYASFEVDRLPDPVNGTGDFSISDHSRLYFGSSVSSGETVGFNSAGKLILGQPSSFDGTIDDFFTKGDSVVAEGFAEAATLLTYTQTGADSCSWTLTDGSHMAVLNFAGEPYAQSDFKITSSQGGAGLAIKFV